MCWKEASINWKIFAFIVSGRPWAPPAKLSPANPFLEFFVCVWFWIQVHQTPEVSLARPGDAVHGLGKVGYSGGISAYGTVHFKVISVFADAQECMFLTFTPGSHWSCCGICCCSLAHLTPGAWKCWPAAKPVCSLGAVRKYFCEELSRRHQG